MDAYVHVTVGAAIGLITKSTAERVFPALQDECGSSVSCKIAQALEWGTVYGAGFCGALVSHAVMDTLPHGDYLAHYGLLLPNSLWLLREILAVLLVFLLILVALRGRNRLAALFTGIGGVIPDLENLAMMMGRIKPSQALLPSHNGVWPHGQNLGVISFVLEIGLFLLSLAILAVFVVQPFVRSAGQTARARTAPDLRASAAAAQPSAPGRLTKPKQAAQKSHLHRREIAP